MKKALFEGLVRDENGDACMVGHVGADPVYIVSDGGFTYHVDAHRVDEQVMAVFAEQVKDHQPEVSEGILKMMGKADLFMKAQVDSNLKNFDKNMDSIYQIGIPENARVMLGMMGFHVIINRHGEMVRLELPSQSGPTGQIDE